MKTRQVILSLILLLTLLSGAWARELSVEELLKKHEMSLKSLDDLQAAAHLELQVLLGILPYRESLDGSYYYQKPDKHKLEFPNAPSYLKKAPSMFNWNLPSLEKYKAVAVAPDGTNPDSTYQLFYKPNNPESATQSVACFFDAKTFRLTRQDTSYKDGGSVKLKFSYLKNSEVPVLEAVAADVSIPSYKLTGAAVISLSAQKANKGLDRGIFGEP